MSAFRLPLLLRATRYTAQSTPVMRRSYAVAAEQHATATATATPTAGTPTPAAADLPKQAPFDGVPFTAPPRDDTKGQLGQVFLPDMYAIEPFPEEQVIIVSWSVLLACTCRGKGVATGELVRLF